MISSGVDTKTENFIVASIFRDDRLMSEFWDDLKPNIFLSRPARTLLEVMREQWVANEPLDEPRLFRVAASRGVDVADCISVISEAWTGCSNGALRYHLDAVRDTHTVLTARAVIEERLSGLGSVEALRSLSEHLASVITPETGSKHTIKADSVYDTIVDEVEAVIMGKPMAVGVPTGIPKLDKLTGGMNPKKLWIISGESSDGKSVLAGNMAKGMLNAGKKVAFYSWEMPADSIVRRFVADLGTVSLNIFTGEKEVDRHSQEGLLNAGRWMKEHGGNLQIVEAAMMSFADVMADIRLKVLRDGISLVVIDYLQLMDLNDLADSREQQVSKGCSALYRLAQGLGITLVILSQLNDEGKLRESRAPGMDADVLINIRKLLNKEGESDESRRDLFIAKNRGGKRFQTIPCVFMGEYARFAELDNRAWEQEMASKTTQPVTGFKKTFRR